MFATDHVMRQHAVRVGKRDVKVERLQDLPLVGYQQVLSARVKILGQGHRGRSLRTTSQPAKGARKVANGESLSLTVGIL